MANALVCKTSIHGFKSHSVLQILLFQILHGTTVGNNVGTMRFWWTIFFVLLTKAASAQMSDDDVDGLAVRALSNTRVKLTWTAVQSVPCLYDVTYSIFRSKSADFEPADSNRVLSGVKTNSANLTDTQEDSYYHVRAVLDPVYCKPKLEPGYHDSHTMHPLANDSGGLLVTLRTKWRPESSQKGVLSYVVRANYLGLGESTAYYARVRRCAYTLELLDAQGFKISDIPLDVIGTTTYSAKISGLEANDLTKLTSTQYRDFDRGGDWNLEWVCPKD